MDISTLTDLRQLLAPHSRSLSMHLPFTSAMSPSSSRSANLESILGPHHHLGINALLEMTAVSIQIGSGSSQTPLLLISIESELVSLLMLQSASGSVSLDTCCEHLFRFGFSGANPPTTLHLWSPGYVMNTILVMMTLLQSCLPMLLVVSYLRSSLTAVNALVKRWNNFFPGGTSTTRKGKKRKLLNSALPDRLVKNCKRRGPDQVEKVLRFSIGMT